MVPVMLKYKLHHKIKLIPTEGMTRPDYDKLMEGVILSSEVTSRKIVGRVLDIAFRKVFSSNAYIFAGVMRIQ